MPQENSLFSHSLKQLDVVVHTCNPSSWEAEVKVHRLLSEFKAILGDLLIPSLKTNPKPFPDTK